MRLQDVILRDTRANQPAAGDVAVGTLYCVSDESNKIERSSGSAWQVFGAAGGGDLLGPGSSVLDDAIIVWHGTSGISVQDSGVTLASLLGQAVASGVAAGQAVFAPLPDEVALGSLTGAVTVDWTDGAHQWGTLTGDVTLTFSGGVVGASYRLILAQDGSGGHTPTWPLDVAFEGGAAPSVDPIPGDLILGSFVCTDAGGGGYLGFLTTRTLTL